MAKGAVAKENAAKKMAEVFGSNWIGEYDKKYYIWSEENGEKVQIAISMTCPKTPIGEAGAVTDSNVDCSSSLNCSKTGVWLPRRT